MSKLLFALFAFVCVVVAVDDKSLHPFGSPILEEANEDLIAYWTPERMKSAIPLDNKKDFNVTEILEKIDPNAKPGFVEGYNPNLDVEYMNVTSIEACALAGAYAPTYSAYPWVTVGKIFFNQGGVSYVCSGASINNYGIITAGHCVYSLALGQWSTSFIFVPAYNNGVAPYGIFSAYQLWILTGYLSGINTECYDYAFVSTCKYSGLTVGQWVGWLGLTWNAGLAQTWTSLGYPQAAPFNGLWNYYTVSSLCTQDGPCTQGIASDTTGGASGGPWVIGWGSTNYVNSVNAYVYVPQLVPPQIFGPYFDANVYSLFTTAFATVPTC